MKLSDKAEEILEALWIAVEEKGQGYGEKERIQVPADDPAYRELTDLAYVEVRDGRVYLRPEGKEEGRRTIRRHRLAERLMMDVLNIRGETGDSKACQFEHLLHEGVDAKVCMGADNARDLDGLATVVPEGDEVSLLAAVSGG